jgi:hypothetical protein
MRINARLFRADDPDATWTPGAVKALVGQKPKMGSGVGLVVAAEIKDGWVEATLEVPDGYLPPSSTP